jgi:hypothetical protein
MLGLLGQMINSGLVCKIEFGFRFGRLITKNVPFDFGWYVLVEHDYVMFVTMDFFIHRKNSLCEV